MKPNWFTTPLIFFALWTLSAASSVWAQGPPSLVISAADEIGGQLTAEQLSDVEIKIVYLGNDVTGGFVGFPVTISENDVPTGAFVEATTRYKGTQVLAVFPLKQKRVYDGINGNHLSSESTGDGTAIVRFEFLDVSVFAVDTDLELGNVLGFLQKKRRELSS